MQSAGYTRRGFAAMAAGTAISCNRPPAAERPNILFILADDLSWAHVSAEGSGMARTPHFDRLAAEGVRFRHSFTASPSCTPSRSSILMGRHQWQCGEAGVLYGAIPPDYPLFPHLLQDAGYHVGWTGKGWAPGTWDAAGLKRHPLGREYNERKLKDQPSPAIFNGDYAANFAAFLQDRPKGAPFCFWLGSKEPHRGYERGYGERMGKKPGQAEVPPFLPDNEVVRNDLLDYAAEIEWFDSQTGKALAELERSGELDRTIVVATSDNGMPFPRAKANLYDWGVRMPLAIRWGNRVRKGRVTEDFVSHVDFAPTFLEAAGVPVPPSMAGRSLLPLLRGEPQTGRDAAFMGMERHTMCRPDGATYPMRAIRTREFLYIRNFAPDRWPGGGPEFVSSNKTFEGDVDEGPSKTEVIADEGTLHELALGKRPAEELYDLAKDPAQIRNVAARTEYASALAPLRTRLEAYLRQTGDPRIDGHDPWQAYVYRQTDGYGASFNRSLSEERRREARERPTHKPE
ncbi:MAG: sulfatase [Acidobacteria bacterium]|nr:sulfatase [Acidobacteriota bacterium]